MPVKELVDERFGSLVVVERSDNDGSGSARWLCVCDCGERRTIAGTGLRAGRNKSCGCASPRFSSESLKTHGMSGTRTHSIWIGMRRRCSSAATGKTRKNYFDKGIRVCSRWESFDLFLEDMGEAPEGLSIERRNGLLGYSKSNCKWATPTEQANNTSSNTIVHHNGESMTVAMWAKRLGIKRNTLTYRLLRGLPIERALQPSIGNSRAELAKERARTCLVCGSQFTPRSTQVRSGVGLYCSQACNGESRRGLKTATRQPSMPATR